MLQELNSGEGEVMSSLFVIVVSLIIGLWLERIIKLDWMLSICPACSLIEPWNLNRLGCWDCLSVGKSGVQSSHDNIKVCYRSICYRSIITIIFQYLYKLQSFEYIFIFLCGHPVLLI